MKSKAKILMLGSGTSLGTRFAAMAKKRGHRVFTELKKDHMAFNWVVNCYGRNQLDRIGETSDRNGLTSMLLVDNVMPIYWSVNALVARGHPAARVLSVASQTHRVPQTNTALYCASKAALVQLTRVMARELAPNGWVINCIAPGKIEDTRMAEVTDAQVRKLRGWSPREAESYALRNIPMRRFTNTTEVCEAMFGILTLPVYINGTCIDMTGGA